MPRVVLLVVTVLTTAVLARAQDAHYWDNQYGTKGELLGGVVVGAPSDLSATFYNPAWLALRTDASLLLTTRALEYSTLEIRNAAGTGDNPRHTQFRPSPGFLGGRFKAGGADGWSVTWSYLERTRFRYEATARLLTADPSPPPEGNAWFSGEAFRRLETGDYWYGASFARRLGERTAFGVTPYVAYRSQNQRIQAAARALDGAGRFGEIHYVDQFSYWHLRAVAKVGLAVDGDPVSCGVAITTPSASLFGSGEIYDNRSSSGIDADGDGTVDLVMAASEQTKLDARWRSPMSVSAGASWRIGSAGLHATVEWFDAVPGYDVISAASYAAQSDGAAVTPLLSVHLHSLVNFGVGFDNRFSDRFSIYAAFRSDFSAQGERPASDVLLATWDLWHVSAGASFQFLGIELTSGLEYAFGSGRTFRGFDFSQTENPEVVGGLYETDVDYRRLKLLIGFDLALLTGGGDGP